MSGLCIFISSHLSAYTSVKMGEFGFYGTICPPMNTNGDEIMEVSFISTYRNPSLDQEQNDKYFKEVHDEAAILMQKTSLIYYCGDINVYNARYLKTDLSSSVYCYPNTPGYKLYSSMIDAFPSLHESMHSGVTHIPRNPEIKTCSQLDYIFCLHNGRFPKGNSRLLVGTASDHYGIVCKVNIPKFNMVRPIFEERWRCFDTDYYLVDQTLRKLRLANPIRDTNVESDFVNHEIQKQFLIESTTHYCKRTMPKDVRHPILVRIKILQSKAYAAHQNKQTDVFKDLENQLRVCMTEYSTTTMRNASKDRNSAQFYSWCRHIAKPTKATLGKFVMRNDDVQTIAREININYTNPTPNLEWMNHKEVPWDDHDKVMEHYDDFDFVEAAQKVQKVPEVFKKLLHSEAQVARQLTKCIIQTQKYPSILKYSDCTLLPARSIFSSSVPVNKVVEQFFNELIDVTKLDNYAYRPQMSCTSLLLAQFDTFSTTKTVYCVNADLKKAFDTMDRNAILGTIDNALVSNILASWTRREDAGYSIVWRGERTYIERSTWNRGVEPGSIIGPKLFIKGLQCSTKVYLGAISKRKNIYADDSLPQYTDELKFKSDIVEYLKHVQSMNMKVHMDGEKAISFMMFGADCSQVGGQLDLEVDGRPVIIRRDFRVKQLGLVFEASKTGVLSIDISAVIDRVRAAYFSLKHASSCAMASVLISTVLTFIIPAINYAIAVWFPILQADKKSRQLKQLRYWYCCTLAACCFESNVLLGWSNSTRTLTENTETELKLAHLTGLPVLNSIYQASALSHYPQLIKLCSLGWMDGVVKFYERTQKCAYLKKELADGSHKRVSPVRVLIDVVNSIRTHDLVSVRRALAITSELKMIETLFCKDYSKQKIRVFQRILSLHVFGKINDDYVKRKLNKESLDFAAAEENQNNLAKRARIVYRNVKDRPATIQKVLNYN